MTLPDGGEDTGSTPVTPGIFDAVLPIHADDLVRTRLLAASLRRFVDWIDTLWVVADEETLEPARAALAGTARRVMPVLEQELVPELGSWRLKIRPRWVGAARPGYRAQQLIKLGIAERVGTPFYLTLDADVLAVRTVGTGWLAPDGRARTVRYSSDRHRNWYRVASEILGLPASGWVHSVTPSLLSKDCVRSMLAFLERPQSRRGVARVSEDVTISGRWRRSLLKRHDWTEYTLYHTFVEAAGAFDTYHTGVDPDQWYGANVWNEGAWDRWAPEQAFEGPRTFAFSVIQSTAGRSDEEVQRSVGRYLGLTASG